MLWQVLWPSLRSTPSVRSSDRSGVAQRRAAMARLSGPCCRLVLADGPLLVGQVELEVERQLGGAVSHASVKAALSKRTGEGLLFRQRRGLYGARVDTNRRWSV